MNKTPSVFSICIPTYNRPTLLKQTVQSILNQSFEDYEIIIGNDYTEKALTFKELGFFDKRIRIINNKINLGEIGNMNFLLSQARGKYFTWQFDDDFYALNFLEAIYYYIQDSETEIGAVFTSHKYYFGISKPVYQTINVNQCISYSGPAFACDAIANKIKTMGACGVYLTNFIKKIGGAKSFSNAPIGLYSENDLLLKTSMLEKVLFINSPLISYRDHENSWSGRNLDTEVYFDAGITFLTHAILFIQTKKYLNNNIFFNLYKMTIDNLVSRFFVKKTGLFFWIELKKYNQSLIENLNFITGLKYRSKLIEGIQKKHFKVILLALIKGVIKRSNPLIQNIIRSFRSKVIYRLLILFLIIFIFF